MFASSFGFGGRVGVLRHMIARGADANSQDECGRTPLIHTIMHTGKFPRRVRRRYVPVVRALLELAPISARRDASGRSALDWALLVGKTDLVPLLFAHCIIVSPQVN